MNGLIWRTLANCVVFFCLLTNEVFAFDSLTPEMRLQEQAINLKSLELDNGFVKNTGSDGYFTFRNLDLRRDQACAIRMDIEFDKPMSRPGLFELFWHEPNAGFRESLKAFVLINQLDTQERNVFLIPLCKLFHYSGNINAASLQASVAGLRFDYPSNKSIGIKFHSFELLNAERMMDLISDTPEGMVVLEPYERLSPAAATSLDVLVPKLFFILEEGFSRLWIDKWFLFFWLLLILGLKLLMLKSFLKK